MAKDERLENPDRSFPALVCPPLLEPASPPGDAPALNVRAGETKCDGFAGLAGRSCCECLVGKVMRGVSFIFYQPGCFPLYQAALKKKKKGRKERKATKPPLKPGFITAAYCSASQLALSLMHLIKDALGLCDL